MRSTFFWLACSATAVANAPSPATSFSNVSSVFGVHGPVAAGVRSSFAPGPHLRPFSNSPQFATCCVSSVNNVVFALMLMTRRFGQRPFGRSSLSIRSHISQFPDVAVATVLPNDPSLNCFAWVEAKPPW